MPVNGRAVWSARIEAQLIRALGEGVPRRVACRAVGLGLTSFYEWMNLGKDPKHPKADFRAKVQRAEAMAIQKSVTAIRKGMAKDWKAAAWYLKTRVPEFQEKREVKASVEGSVDLRSDDLRQAVLDALASDPTQDQDDSE